MAVVQTGLGLLLPTAKGLGCNTEVEQQDPKHAG